MPIDGSGIWSPMKLGCWKNVEPPGKKRKMTAAKHLVLPSKTLKQTSKKPWLTCKLSQSVLLIYNNPQVHPCYGLFIMSLCSCMCKVPTRVKVNVFMKYSSNFLIVLGFMWFEMDFFFTMPKLKDGTMRRTCVSICIQKLALLPLTKVEKNAFM